MPALQTATPDFSFFLPLTKVKENKDGSVTVSGYASTPSLDLDGEIVSLDAVKNALPGYWQWRNIREMHKPSAVGVAQEANVDSTGLFLTSRITDTIAAKKCLDGVYKGYSIGGKKLAKVGNTVTELDLIEISIVDRPANPDCKLSVAKSASPDAEAYLVEAKEKLSKEQKALRKMANVVATLAKAGPPAAHDGFSLPAKTKCAAHGKLDCEECAKTAKEATNASPKDIDEENNKVSKREFSDDDRKRLAQSGAALPDGSYPIENKDDLHNAVQAFGRAGDKPKAKKHIMRRAKALGHKDVIPSGWRKTGKSAPAVGAASSPGAIALVAKSAEAPSFLTLSADGRRTEGAFEPGVSGGRGGALTRKDGAGFLDLRKQKPVVSTSTSREDFSMNGQTTGVPTIDQAIMNIIKRASTPSRAAMMKAAEGNIKKAKKARKEAAAAMADCHKMHKAAYLAKEARAELIKAGKKPKPDDDDDDFDHAGAMEKLQKAYGALEKLKTFQKAAGNELAKAAARSGQRGQEAGDGESGFYEVPAGVTDLSPAALAGAAPGTKGGGSQPPMYPGDGAVYPGKAAQFADKNGNVSLAVAELLAKNASLESQNDVLARMPANGKQRPYSFDLTKVMSGGDGQHGREVDPLRKAIIDSGVSVASLENDEGARGAVIGNYLMGGAAGHSILDPTFRGRAGTRPGA